MNTCFGARESQGKPLELSTVSQLECVRRKTIRRNEFFARKILFPSKSAWGRSGVKKPVFLNRLLVFLFASDESFKKLMMLPKDPFKMGCGNQLCVNILHITDEVD